MTQAKIKKHPAVKSIHKEQDDGSQSNWWVYLKEGYINPHMECGVIHEHTLKECYSQLKSVVKK